MLRRDQKAVAYIRAAAGIHDARMQIKAARALIVGEQYATDLAAAEVALDDALRCLHERVGEIFCDPADDLTVVVRP